VDAGFWSGRCVLLTGHTGFKGGWMSLWLQQLGAEVIGYALEPPSMPSLFDTARVGEGMVSITGDIRDQQLLESVLRRYRPSIVIHMAAQPLVKQAYAEPVDTYAVNVMGTVNLLQAVRAVKDIDAVINVTSDKCYENREWVWAYREADGLGGSDPYSSSKACSELVTAAYRQSYFQSSGVPGRPAAVATARAGNVIGGGDWAQNRLIPDIVRASAHGDKAVEIRRPSAIRPWQHVLEPVCGYIILAQELARTGACFAESWNFGPDGEDVCSVRFVTEQWWALWGRGSVNFAQEPEGPHEAHTLKIDSSKARARLGWRPRWKLRQALAQTVRWYQAFEAGQDMRALTVAQINGYSDADR